MPAEPAVDVKNPTLTRTQAAPVHRRSTIPPLTPRRDGSAQSAPSARMVFAPVRDPYSHPCKSSKPLSEIIPCFAANRRADQ